MFRVRGTTVTGRTARDCAVSYFGTEAVMPFGPGIWISVMTGARITIDLV